MTKILPIIHKAAALAAFTLIVTFFISSLMVDMFGDQQALIKVKANIFQAVWLLIPLMALAGMTGAKMAPKVTSGPIALKKKRMPYIALNGLFILLPAAYILNNLAQEGEFNRLFYLVQTIELLAGFINISLMSFNIRDAMSLKRNARQPVTKAPNKG
jgi:hypothetical protein